MMMFWGPNFCAILHDPVLGKKAVGVPLRNISHRIRNPHGDGIFTTDPSVSVNGGSTIPHFRRDGTVVARPEPDLDEFVSVFHAVPSDDCN